MCELVRYHGAKFLVGFSKIFCAFLTNCFGQSAHNLKVVLLIGSTTLCQEFVMHHAIAIEDNKNKTFSFDRS